MSIELDLQVACDAKVIPSKEQLQLWVETALASSNKDFELTIRIVETDESQTLNNQYRHKDKPTNVLSFPFEVPEGIPLNLLGDLVVCADIVALEAEQQNKELFSHWAHMIIHGCLHLLGYDHINDLDANEMETLEIQLLSTLKINNPYQEL